MEKNLGSLLTESHEELYGKKISVVDFKKKQKGDILIEWAVSAPKDDDLIVHIFSAGKWPLNYAKLLYALMDELAPGEERDIGYEDLPNSWYILSRNFVKNKLSPDAVAEKLCKDLLNKLA